MTGVVGTLMTNLGFEHALGRLGIPFARAKVGDRYVLEMMQERGWLLGGENSGHIICLDKHTTGDGIIAALQVLAALRANGESLAEACADLTMYPQKLINVRMPAGFDWKSDHWHRGGRQAGGSGARRQRTRPAATVGHRAGAARHGRGQRWPAGHGSGGKHRRGGARGRRRLTGGREASNQEGLLGACSSGSSTTCTAQAMQGSKLWMVRSTSMGCLPSCMAWPLSAAS